jgi:probable rRNA maturation factor
MPDLRIRGRRPETEPGADMGKIAIATPQETVPVDRALMRNLARTVLEGEGFEDAQISLAFVDNPTVHRLNQRYLDHDEPTDVLSFPLSEPGARKLTGELVIGAEVAQAQAQARGHDVQAELALYVIHGLLHLCGYDDKTPEGAAEMRRLERQYLAAVGLPDIAEAE